MKIKIRYQYDEVISPHFFAKSEVNGRQVISSGNSWSEARERMIRRVKVIEDATSDIPKEEEVEIP